MHSAMPLVGQSLALFTICLVLMCLAVITVFLRIIVRLYIVRAFGWDDGLMTVGMFFFVGYCILLIGGAMAGVGHHQSDFPTTTLLEKALLWWWLAQIFYIWSSAFAKLSIALAMLRVTISKIHIWILRIVMGIVIASGIVFWLLLLFYCKPVSFFWKRLNPDAIGTCLAPDVVVNVAYLYSVLIVFCDLTLSILPIFLVYNLQMNRRTKVAVAGILSIGAMASIAVIIRLPFLHHYKDPDFLHSTFSMAVCTVAENGLGITAASLITLRPLFRWILDKSRLYSLGQSYEQTGSRNHQHYGLKSSGISLTPNPKHTKHTTTISALSNRISSQSLDSQECLRPTQGVLENHVNVHETILVTEERVDKIL